MIVIPGERNRVGLAATTDAKLHAADFSGSGLEALGGGLEQVGKAGGKFADALDDRQAREAAAARKAQAERVEALHDDGMMKHAYRALTERSHEVLHTGEDALLKTVGIAASGARQRFVEEVLPLRKTLLDQVDDPGLSTLIAGTLDTRIHRDLARVQAHAEEQTAVWQKEQAQGVLDSAAADALETIGTPLFVENVATGLRVIENQAAIENVPPEVRRAQEADYISGIHARAIDRQVMSDPVGAQAYAGLYQREIGAADRAVIDRALHLPMIERDGAALVDGYAGASGAAAPQAAVPAGSAVSVADRMTAITMRREAVPSPATASAPVSGEQSEHDDTGPAQAPAPDATPVAPMPPADRAAVGGSLAGMIDRYGGDPAKAWAAYKLGAERVDAALATRGDAWFGEMPPEVRDYVANNVAMLSGGSGYVPKREELGAIRAYIEGQDTPPEVKRAALADAEARVVRGERAIKLKQDDATNAAYAAADDLGENFTSITQIHPATQRDLPPETLTALTRQARQNALGLTVGENGQSIADLNQLAASDPAAFLTKDLRLVRDTMTPAEYAGLAKLQDALRADPASPLAVAHRRIWDKIAREGAAAGLALNDPATRQRAQALFARLQGDLAAETHGKRVPTDEEIAASLDRAAVHDRVVTPGTGDADGDDAIVAADLPAANDVASLTGDEFAAIQAHAKANGWDARQETQAIQDYAYRRSHDFTLNSRVPEGPRAANSFDNHTAFENAALSQRAGSDAQVRETKLAEYIPATFTPSSTDGISSSERTIFSEVTNAIFEPGGPLPIQPADPPASKKADPEEKRTYGLTASSSDPNNRIMSGGKVLDPALKVLVDIANQHDVYGLEKRYRLARADVIGIRKDIDEQNKKTISDGRTAELNRLNQRLDRAQDRLVVAAEALAPGLTADAAIQAFYVGKYVSLDVGSVRKDKKGVSQFDADGRPRFISRPTPSRYQVQGPSARFKTADEAAFDAIAMARLVGASKGDAGERTGYIVARDDGSYTYEYPYILGKTSIKKLYSTGVELEATPDQNPRPRNAVGMWHTHPRGGAGDNQANVYFGDADISAPQLLADKIGRREFSAYVGGSDGGVRVIRNVKNYRPELNGHRIPHSDYIDIGPGYFTLK